MKYRKTKKTIMISDLQGNILFKALRIREIQTREFLRCGCVIWGIVSWGEVNRKRKLVEKWKNMNRFSEWWEGINE